MNMNGFISNSMEKLLKSQYKYDIYHFIAMRAEPIFMIFIYFKTDKELNALADEDKEKIKSICIDFLKEYRYIPHDFKTVWFKFDSDENVQKHYQGSYFYATR